MTDSDELDSLTKFPAYTHIPSVTPHPINNPRGHSFQLSHIPCETPQWTTLPNHRHFQCGLELFNAGYYWEAHESWEGVWNAAGRQGLVADYVKGLIKIAAAGVKLWEGSSDGARKHLARAEELLLLTRTRVTEQFPETLTAESRVGQQLLCTLELVQALQSNLPDLPQPRSGQPRILLGKITSAAAD